VLPELFGLIQLLKIGIKMLTSLPFVKSNNSDSKDLVRQFIVPSPLQAVIYLLVSMLLLVLIKARAIWEALGGSILIEQSSGAAANTPASTNIWGQISNSPIPQIVFWGAIGMIMYAVVWFAWNIITNLRNDMAADEFVHPKNYDRSKYWKTVLARKGFFAASVLLIAIYLYALAKFLPVIADASYSDIASFSFPSSVIGLVLYFLVIGALIHLFVLLIRVMANAWRSIYKDL